MMDPSRLHDVFCRGMGRAAAILGSDHDLFRPDGPALPINSRNLTMRLPITFEAEPSSYSFGQETIRGYRGTFDCISTQVGDYLQGKTGLYFVAALPLRARPFCVKADVCVSLLRTAGPTAAGLNPYGGVLDGAMQTVLDSWPVSWVQAGSGKAGDLASDRNRSSVKIVFPLTPQPIRAADILVDVQGNRFVVLTAQALDCGWRLTARGTEV